MPANTILQDFDEANRNGLNYVKDPGSAGTIAFSNLDFGVCEIVTAATETRVLESATLYGLGTILHVLLKTDGGDVVISGVSPSVITLSDAGDLATFIVSESGSTKVWKLLSSSRQAAQLTGSSGFLTFDVPIGNNWRAPTALTSNLGTADSGSGSTVILGLETGAIASAGNTLNVTFVNPSGVVASARDNTSFKLPINYRAGANVIIRVTTSETVAATTAEVDFVAVDQDAPTTDLVTTAATTIVGLNGTPIDFTITGTGLVPGDVLDVLTRINLTEAAATPEYDITRILFIVPVG